jgi:hypothetical protein
MTCLNGIARPAHVASQKPKMMGANCHVLHIVSQFLCNVTLPRFRHFSLQLEEWSSWANGQKDESEFDTWQWKYEYIFTFPTVIAQSVRR